MTSIVEAIPAIEPGDTDLSSPSRTHRACATPTTKILCIVGARPNFMKIAPILRAFREHAPHVEAKLVHTGQHYDYAMNQAFFDQLGIPQPDISLEVGSGSHARQTAEIMTRFEPLLDAEQSECVLVVGGLTAVVPLYTLA